ncbi:MAG TPA: PDZ domain-containing protein, partial [Candidatus Limnocylindria bacterium]|nr:PDZ domain-containing protein [Candidatus Limnocylindria bacterium]
YMEAGRPGGAGGPGGGPGGGGGNELMRYRLCDRRAITFVNGVAAYEISADRRKLVYRAAGGGGGQARGPGGGGGTPPPPQLFLIDADRTPPQAGSGRLNFSLRMYLEPKEEFKQIFNEGWRNQRDYLYVQNMHGTDWPKMKEMYGQLLPYAMHRADLNYLMDVMGAELAVGHSYVRGGDMPSVPPVVGGLLGADFTIDQGRYKVTRIYDNESWNPDLRSPLATPGANVNVGD